jgi:hypothetical protein
VFTESDADTGVLYVYIDLASDSAVLIESEFERMYLQVSRERASDSDELTESEVVTVVLYAYVDLARDSAVLIVSE